MLQSRGASALAAALQLPHAVLRRPAIPVGVAGAALLAAAVVLLGHSPAVAAATCDRSATPSTFASAISAATSGQTVCLASGSYGTWSGTSKAITVRAASGATPTMQVSFGSGDSGFTLDGMSGMGGNINGGAKNITISNSTFSSTIDIEGALSDVVLDHDHFDWKAVSSSGGPNAKIFVDVSGTLASPALTVKNSTIVNGDLDGVHIGGGSGALILNNQFENLCDRNVNHTDNLQFEGGSQIRIAGNYVYASQSCATQGLTSYDGGTNGVIIEDNVVDIPRDWGIELYSDKNSIVRHNTVVYRPKTYTEFNTEGGQIDIDRKSQDPAGTGTQVYDNIATSVDFTNGSSGTQHNNVSGQTAKYVGPTSSWPGYKLSSDSPVGVKAADDGSDDGIRVSGSPAPPPPQPTPTPSPTPKPGPNTPAKAVWTAPSGARVGTAVTLDGTKSTGDAPLSCKWTFEDQGGSTVYETQTGCKLSKTFKYTGTKYVRLTVSDANGDTNANKQSFNVSAAGAADTPAKASWTAPKGAKVGQAVTLDATKSTGDAPLACTWTFEDQSSSTVYETQTGCKLSKAFKFAGTKYVRLTVKDADRDTNANKQSFAVAAT